MNRNVATAEHLDLATQAGGHLLTYVAVDINRPLVDVLAERAKLLPADVHVKNHGGRIRVKRHTRQRALQLVHKEVVSNKLRLVGLHERDKISCQSFDGLETAGSNIRNIDVENWCRHDSLFPATLGKSPHGRLAEPKTNASRNARAQGDESSLPAPRGYDDDNASVFARTTNVRPRLGTLMMSDEMAVQ